MYGVVRKNTAAQRAQSDMRRTPQDFFDRLDREFHFTLDAAAGHEEGMHKCERYFTLDDDALQQSWATESAVFCNPPYSGIRPWIEKAYEESERHRIPVVLIVPSSTGLRWWAWAFERAAEMRFVTGHMSFTDNKNRATFGTLVIVFCPKRSATCVCTAIERDEAR